MHALKHSTPRLEGTSWLHFAPPDPRGGDPQKAEDMAAGLYELAGTRLELPPEGNPFSQRPPSAGFARALEGFGWLRHFSAAPQRTLREHAHTLVRHWLKHPRPRRHPEDQGRRLAAWVGNGILLGEDTELRGLLAARLAQQMRALARPHHLTASFGLALSALCVPGGAVYLKDALHALQRALREEILPDGGHISRNPQKQLSILLDLLHLREALSQRDLPLPVDVTRALERMVPMVRFFLHGDHRLAVFNGGGEGESAWAAVALREDQGSRPFSYAPHTRYQRLSARRLLILVDNGIPPPLKFSQKAHAGFLAFEMSIGKHRVVVNSGGRESSAHATLTVNNTSPAHFFSGPLRWLFGPRLWGGASRIESRPMQNAEGLWLEIAHNGYARSCGVLHRRRLFLAASGDEVRGEDSLERVPLRRRTLPWCLRFPLHPNLQIAPTHNHKQVLIVLPNKSTWQFRARAHEEDLPLALDSQVYTAGSLPQKMWHILLEGTLLDTVPGLRVNWAFSHLKKEHP